MSFAPLLGSESPTIILVQDLVFACFASLATYFSWLSTKMIALADDAVEWNSESWCPICQLKRLPYRVKCLFQCLVKKKKRRTAVLVFDHSTNLYTVIELESIDSESAAKTFQAPSYSSRT